MPKPIRLAALPLPLLLGLATAGRGEAPSVARTTVEARAKAMFGRADVDRDGWLTRAEYRAAVTAIARHYDPQVPTDGAGMAAVMAQFDALDTQHAGRISRAVFVAAALAHFDGADLNHDGQVTPEEARKAARIKQKMLDSPH